MKKTILTIFTLIITLYAAELQVLPHFHPFRFDVGMQHGTISEANSLRLAGHTEMSFPRIQFRRPNFKIGLSHFAGMIINRNKNFDNFDQTMFNGGTGFKLFRKNMSYIRFGLLRGKNGLDRNITGRHITLGIAPGNRTIGVEASYQYLDGENSVTVSVFMELVDFILSRL